MEAKIYEHVSLSVSQYGNATDGVKPPSYVNILEKHNMQLYAENKG